MPQSIYDTITSQIVAAIEEGAADYRMPWHRSRFDVASPSNAEGGHAYGTNLANGYGVALVDPQVATRTIDQARVQVGAAADLQHRQEEQRATVGMDKTAL